MVSKFLLVISIVISIPANVLAQFNSLIIKKNNVKSCTSHITRIDTNQEVISKNIAHKIFYFDRNGNTIKVESVSSDFEINRTYIQKYDSLNRIVEEYVEDIIRDYQTVNGNKKSPISKRKHKAFHYKYQYIDSNSYNKIRVKKNPDEHIINTFIKNDSIEIEYYHSYKFYIKNISADSIKLDTFTIEKHINKVFIYDTLNEYEKKLISNTVPNIIQQTNTVKVIRRNYPDTKIGERIFLYDKSNFEIAFFRYLGKETFSRYAKVWNSNNGLPHTIDLYFLNGRKHVKKFKYSYY